MGWVYQWFGRLDESIELCGWIAVIAGVEVSVLLATSTRYGYHRDELYFIVAGAHPAFGCPDQPPLVPLLCWAVNAIAANSLLLLRTPSALIAGATTTLAAVIAREVGGRMRAQVIAAACTASSAFALAVAHLRVGLDNQEQGLPVMLCRPTAAWAALWPRLTH